MASSCYFFGLPLNLLEKSWLSSLFIGLSQFKIFTFTRWFVQSSGFALLCDASCSFLCVWPAKDLVQSSLVLCFGHAIFFVGHFSIETFSLQPYIICFFVAGVVSTLCRIAACLNLLYVVFCCFWCVVYKFCIIAVYPEWFQPLFLVRSDVVGTLF